MSSPSSSSASSTPGPSTPPALAMDWQASDVPPIYADYDWEKNEAFIQSMLETPEMQQAMRAAREADAYTEAEKDAYVKEWRAVLEAIPVAEREPDAAKRERMLADVDRRIVKLSERPRLFEVASAAMGLL